jgi:hypothetical protein
MNKLIRRFWNGVLFAGRDDIRDIKLSLALLLIKDEIIMATLQEVKDAVAAEAAEVTAKVNELLVEIQRLNDLLAAGGSVTAADLDELKASVEAIFVAPPAP